MANTTTANLFPTRVLPYIDRSAGEEECWLWTQYCIPQGYGMVWLAGRSHYVHRLAYEHFVGPIPVALEIDHRCEARNCANPGHMVLATHAENTLRSASNPAAINARKTHCPKGHPYDEANTYYPPGSKGRHRMCRACNNQ